MGSGETAVCKIFSGEIDLFNFGKFQNAFIK
jgi:hypothetical protein